MSQKTPRPTTMNSSKPKPPRFLPRFKSPEPTPLRINELNDDDFLYTPKGRVPRPGVVDERILAALESGGRTLDNVRVITARMVVHPERVLRLAGVTLEPQSPAFLDLISVFVASRSKGSK